MSRRDFVNWEGYWPAAPTPFADDGSLDLAQWQALLELYVAQGAHGVLVNGTTGEWFSQTEDERAKLAHAAVEAVDGRIPVVVGVTAYTAKEAGRLARGVSAAGADGVLATPPPYVHPCTAEIVRYFEGIAASSDLPMMVYNWPRGVAVDLSLEALERLADLEAVVAIKESTGDELKAISVVQRFGADLRVFTRLVYRRGLAVLRELGGDGSIDGGGVGAPFAAPYFDAVWAGKLAEARGFAERYESLTGSLIGPDYGALHGSPTAQLKAVMRILGQPGGFVRPPLLELSDASVLEDLAGRLSRSGIVEALGAQEQVAEVLAGSGRA